MCLPFTHKWSPWQWVSGHRSIPNYSTLNLGPISRRLDGVFGERFCKKCFKHQRKFVKTFLSAETFREITNT